MNLDKARKAYRHDPQYHNLVDGLVNQIEALEMSPSEIREAAVFACIILEERNIYPIRMLSREELEKLAGSRDSTEYRKFVLGDWNNVKPEKRKVLVCTKCHEAIMPGGGRLCNRCKREAAKTEVES